MMEAAIDFRLLVGPNVPTRSYAAGEAIFHEGDPAKELFVVESGRVKVTLGNRQLDEIGENGIFGEMALIDSSPRSATVIAATDVTLVPVTEKQFLFLVAHTPFFALKVMRVMAGRLRTTNRAL
jgi:CRP-like cAMP-binding protein